MAKTQRAFARQPERIVARSNPTVDRQRGVRSKFLIATSSIEQHGYKSLGQRPAPEQPSPCKAHGTTRSRGKQQIRKTFSVFKSGCEDLRKSSAKLNHAARLI